MRWPAFSFAVALSSFSTIAVELLLTRIFSVTMYYHFAFMVISVAMLGLAIAGVAIYLLPRLFRSDRVPLIGALCMLLFAASTLYATRVALANPIELQNWQHNFGRLSAVYLAAIGPMLFSGLAISLAIANAREHIGRIYAFDLFGAAIGCLFVVLVFRVTDGPGALVMGAAAGCAAALLFAASDASPARMPRWLAGGVALAGAVVLTVIAVQEPTQHRFGSARNPGKFLGNRPVLFEDWNSFSQITVAPAGAPDHKWIFIDADAATRIWQGDVARHNYAAVSRIPEIRVAALVYSLRHSRDALIIGPGGGTDVVSALAHGVPKVHGVEVNPIIVNQVMRGAFADFAGKLYDDPRVQVVVDEGRSYVRRSRQTYGSIQATLVDTWAASSSGAFTLSENTIYTVEAFHEFFGHLGQDGIVSMTRWYDGAHPKEFLRLVAIARQALEDLGVPAATVKDHFFLATDGQRRATMLANRAPFTRAELDKLAEVAVAGSLQVLYAPQPLTGPLAPTIPNAHSSREDAFLASFLRTPEAHGFLAGLAYDASPTHDDRPFFFYNLRLADLLGILGTLADLEINNLGIAILLAILVLATIVTILLVLLPLLLFERRSLKGNQRAKLRVLAYFLCLGLGFILVEIGFMQKFVLFLGHPIYALAVVLAGLLAASGLGSSLSGRSIARFGMARHLRLAVATLAAVLLVYAVVLTPLFHALLGLPLLLRVLISMVLVAIPGVIMGTFLPVGVHVAGGMGAGTVAWGWGLNGAASVVGSILALTLSMNFGFSVALVIGLAVYGLALLSLPVRAQPLPSDA